jgi:SRSO17 transposase
VVLVIDETGFLKQGNASCGVARQYTGSAGKITNCQIVVFAAYVSRHGHAFIDRAFYLPKAWTDDPARMAKAHVPEKASFASKPALVLAMIERALAADVPFSWVAADSVYGVGDIEMALRRAGKGYVLGVNANRPFRSWAKPQAAAGTTKDIAESLPEGHGGACRRAMAPRVNSFTTGSISNWPISMSTTWMLPQRRLDARAADPPQHRRW